jgi:hypothetical protein
MMCPDKYPQGSVTKPDYLSPVCELLSLSSERTILSGFPIDDWKDDPDEIG